MDGIDPRLTDIRDCLYRVALKAIIVINGKLLLTEERSGKFNLPGGGLDYHEDIETALLRELKEEVGLGPQDVTIQLETPTITNKGLLYNIPWMNVYYQVKIQDEALVQAGELNFKWVGKDELATIALSPAMAKDRNFLLAQL